MKNTIISTIAALALTTAPAYAGDCTGKYMELVDYTVTQDGSLAEFTGNFKTNFEKPVRILDALFAVEDVLEARTNSGWYNGWSFKRHMQIDVGGILTQESRIDEERLLTLRKEDLVITVCVKGVVYEDGSLELFE